MAEYEPQHAAVDQAQVAAKRGWQTLLQSLAVDVAVGVALVLLTFIGPLQGWGDVQWAILGFTVAKSVVQAVAAWVIRRWIDQSGFNRDGTQKA